MAKLERYGLEWSGPKDFVAKPMPDGYWTPWHIAQAAVDAAILNWGGVAKRTRTTPSADAMMGEITGETSDGYHTFNELYEHRHILFLALLMSNRDKAWRSKLHSDGTMFDGWFIAGIETALGQATYHLPERIWSLFDAIETMDKAPEWDGHTSNDVVERIREHALQSPAPVTDDAAYLALDRLYMAGNNSRRPPEEIRQWYDTMHAAISAPNREKELLECVEKIEQYGFQCEVGPISLCKEWLELKGLINGTNK